MNLFSRIVSTLVVAASLCSSVAAAVVGSSNLNVTFTPSTQLSGRSDVYFLPDIPELQFSILTTGLDSSGNVEWINGNVTIAWENGYYGPVARFEFIPYSWFDIAQLPTTVGPGGWVPVSPWETNLSGFWNGLMPFSVERSDGIHYGWVEFSTTPLDFTLHRYGFETVAGQAISFGDTGSAVPTPNSIALVTLGLVAAYMVTRRSRRDATALPLSTVSRG
jgi:hypothetical protein